MAILQFAFDPDDLHGPHRLENHGTDRVAYTGTHDTPTLGGWLESLEPERRAEVDRALREAGLAKGSPVWGLTELWMGSTAPLVMLQAQDLLELGVDARINTPGRARGNWRWRMPEGALTRRHAARLRAMTERAGRA
jgi:4-alpha-glucanotransferase